MALPLMIVLVVVTFIVGYLIYTQGISPPGGSGTSALVGTPVPASTMNLVSGVSFTTLNAIGGGGNGVSSPSSITASSPLTSGGKPEILYIGGEYCPYCAVERWSLAVALSKFGNLSGIQYMLSSATDIPSNVPTFTFAHVSYSSQYISFVAVEETDRNRNPLQNPTSDQQLVWNTYDSSGSIPFVDLGNKYTLVGSQFQPPFPGNNNWTQIAQQLNTPSSPIAQNVDGAANRLIAAICKLTNGQPSSVCSQPGIQTLGLVGGAASSRSQLLAANTWQPTISRDAEWLTTIKTMTWSGAV